MKKPIVLVISLLALAGCNRPAEEHCGCTTKPDDYVGHVNYLVRVDYGMHIQDRITILLDDMLIPFNPSDYGVENLVAGDYVMIDYKGDWLIRQSYPATLDKNEAEIVGVTVRHPSIYEYEVVEDVEGSKSLKHVYAFEEAANFRFPEYCINEDGSYADYLSYDVGTKIYATKADRVDVGYYSAFYSYNPLA